MEAALMAPTDGSLLLWSAIRIKNEELRRNIAEVVGQRSIRFLHISGWFIELMVVIEFVLS